MLRSQPPSQRTLSPAAICCWTCGSRQRAKRRCWTKTSSPPMPRWTSRRACPRKMRLRSLSSVFKRERNHLQDCLEKDELVRRRGWRVEQCVTDGNDAVPNVFQPHSNHQQSLERARHRHVGTNSRLHDTLEGEEELIELAIFGDEPARNGHVARGGGDDAAAHLKVCLAHELKQEQGSIASGAQEVHLRHATKLQRLLGDGGRIFRNAGKLGGELL